MLQCPKCHANLSPQELSGISVDACANCDGLWLDQGRLDTYVSNYVAARGLLKHPAPLLAMPSTPTCLRCPRCQTPTLERVKVRAVVVVRCPACQGVFLSRGDAERIAERTLHAASQSTMPSARRYLPRPVLRTRAEGDWRSMAIPCPQCGRTLYNRKGRTCGFCNAGSSALNRGHEHQRSTRRLSAREGRPRCLGGVQRGGGT